MLLNNNLFLGVNKLVGECSRLCLSGSFLVVGMRELERNTCYNGQLYETLSIVFRNEDEITGFQRWVQSSQSDKGT